MFSKTKLKERRTELLNSLRSRLLRNGSFKKWGLICEVKSSNEDLMQYLHRVKTLNLLLAGVFTGLFVWEAVGVTLLVVEALKVSPPHKWGGENGKNALLLLIALISNIAPLSLIPFFLPKLKDWMATKKG